LYDGQAGDGKAGDPEDEADYQRLDVFRSEVHLPVPLNRSVLKMAASGLVAKVSNLNMRATCSQDTEYSVRPLTGLK
jgi:hypothetical protein